MGHIPSFRRDLVFDQIVFRPGIANPRPALPSRIDQVEVVGNLGHKIVDVGVPIAVETGGEQHSGVVVQKHEAHVMETAHLVSLVEVAAQQLQERTEPLGAAGH